MEPPKRSRLDLSFGSVPADPRETIYTLEEISAAWHTPRLSALLDAPILVPPNWEPNPPKIEQAEYNRFMGNFVPGLTKMLRRINKGTDLAHRVVVAGGAAARPFVEWPYSKESDIDIFGGALVTDTPEQIELVRRQVTNEIRTLINSLIEKGKWTHHDHKNVCVEYVRGGIHTFCPRISKEGKYLKIQYVMVLTEGIGTILSGFDIPACMFAFDGVTTWGTFEGAKAIANRAFTLTREKVTRIEKKNPGNTIHRYVKYFARGFALSVPFFGSREAIAAGRTLDDGSIKIASTENNKLSIQMTAPNMSMWPIIRGNIVDKKCDDGDEFHTPIELLTKRTESTYDMYCNSMIDERVASIISWDTLQYWRVAAGMQPIHSVSGALYTIDDKPLPATYGEVLSNIFAKTDFTEIASTLSGGSLTSFVVVAGMFRLTDEEICRLARKMANESLKGSDKERICRVIQSEIGHKIVDTRANIESKMDKETRWWVNNTDTADVPASPDVVFTHRITDEEKATAARSVLSDTIGRVPIKAGHSQIPCQSEKDCVLCLRPIIPRQRNTITLHCGHTFHFGGSRRDCGGLMQVVGKKCPTCRRNWEQPEENSNSQPLSGDETD